MPERFRPGPHDPYFDAGPEEEHWKHPYHPRSHPEPPVPEQETYPQVQTEKFDEEEYFSWVQRQLGSPFVEVELTKEQVRDGLKEALAFYSRFRPQRATESFITAQGIGVYRLKTPGARGIYHVQMMGVTDGLTSPNIEAQLMSGSYTYYGVAAPKMDLRYYSYLQQWVKFASQQLSSEQDYKIADDGKTLWLYSPGRASKITVEITLDHVNPLTIPSPDQIWIRKYILAYCKILVGETRSKFGSILGANKDISLNGKELKEEGREEIKELEAKIERARTHLSPSWG